MGRPLYLKEEKHDTINNQDGRLIDFENDSIKSIVRAMPTLANRYREQHAEALLSGTEARRSKNLETDLWMYAAEREVEGRHGPGPYDKEFRMKAKELSKIISIVAPMMAPFM
jgi:hypothetical protein